MKSKLVAKIRLSVLFTVLVAMLLGLPTSSAAIAEESDQTRAVKAQITLEQKWGEEYGEFLNARADYNRVCYPEYVVDVRVEEYRGADKCVIYIMDFANTSVVRSQIKSTLGATLNKSVVILAAKNQKYNHNSITQLENALNEVIVSAKRNFGPLTNIGVKKIPNKNSEGSSFLGIEVSGDGLDSDAGIEYFKNNIFDHPAIYFTSVPEVVVTD